MKLWTLVTVKKIKDGVFETTITVNTYEVFIGNKTKEEDFQISIIYKDNWYY